MSTPPMKIEVIGKETIKPSSPTPSNLTNFKLSFLEQQAPIAYIPLVLLYPFTGPVEAGKICQSLKASLSKTLTLFYPLAGRIVDHASLGCNDEGVDFVEARADFTLSEFLQQPDAQIIGKFQPIEIDSVEAVTNNLLLVQATFFKSGGMALGVCISQKVSDAASLVTFINGWAAATAPPRSTKVVLPHPEFCSASIFPAQDTLIAPAPLFGSSSSVTRRFVFHASKIAALKAKAGSETVKEPSRVEAVAALIWKCAMTASRSVRRGDASPKVSIAALTVDLRGLSEPVLPPNYAGNLTTAVTAHSRDNETELRSLVCGLRKGKQELKENIEKKVDLLEESMKKLVWVGELMKRCEIGEIYFFTSWCRFRLYEADFGFGKPIWAGAAVGEVKNVCWLMDTSDGDGIEAWLSLEETEMALLLQNQELLAFASLHPTV